MPAPRKSRPSPPPRLAPPWALGPAPTPRRALPEPGGQEPLRAAARRAPPIGSFRRTRARALTTSLGLGEAVGGRLDGDRQRKGIGPGSLKGGASGSLAGVRGRSHAGGGKVGSEWGSNLKSSLAWPGPSWARRGWGSSGVWFSLLPHCWQAHRTTRPFSLDSLAFCCRRKARFKRLGKPQRPVSSPASPACERAPRRLRCLAPPRAFLSRPLALPEGSNLQTHHLVLHPLSYLSSHTHTHTCFDCLYHQLARVLIHSTDFTHPARFPT